MKDKTKIIIMVSCSIFLVLLILTMLIEDKPICNQNNLCEVELGERFTNCPTDCGNKHGWIIILVVGTCFGIWYFKIRKKR